MKPLPARTFFLLAVSALVLSLVPVAWAGSESVPQIVRLGPIQGDVRLSRGDGKKPDLNRPWEQAQSNIPIEEGFSVVTGTGRAEVEFENGSVAYLADNSVLLFKKLRFENGAPSTEVELITGTATFSIRPEAQESFMVLTPAGPIDFLKPTLIRVDSYLDATALTPEGEHGAQGENTERKNVNLAKGQSLIYQEGRPLHVRSADNSDTARTWDNWVGARVQERQTVMNAALKASGLSSPVPGLADLYQNGSFFPCEPYGTCWQAQDNVPAQQSVSPTDAPAPPRQYNAELIGPYSFNALCPPVGLAFLAMQDEVARGGQVSGDEILYEPWGLGWATCHSGFWIRRFNRYALVVGKPTHRPPVHWVSVAHVQGYVPWHPDDVKGQTPINLKNGLLVPPRQPGAPVTRMSVGPSEKVTVLDGPPKELNNEELPELAHAERPEIRGHLVAERTGGAKGAPAASPASSILFDYKKQAFVKTIPASGSAGSKTVVVGQLGSHGTSSGGAVAGRVGSGGSAGAVGSGARGGGGATFAVGGHAGGSAPAAAPASGRP